MTEGAALVGRDAERRRARSVLESGTGGILLSGALGVGKTALARAIARDIARPVVWAYGTSSGTANPYSAFGPLISLPALGEPGSAMGAIEMLQMTRSSLLAHGTATGLILAVDDAHLLDDASAILLFQLVAGGEAAVVLTMRADEPAPEPVTRLWKDGHVDRIDLAPLDRAESATLIGNLLGWQVDGAALETLWRISAGHPLYLRELVLSGLSSGWLAERCGVWVAAGSLTISPRLRELVRARLDDLDPQTRSALELVALADQLPLAVLERTIEPSNLDEMERRGLLETVHTIPDQTSGPGPVGAEPDRHGHAAPIVQLIHPLYSEVLRAGLPASRARHLRRELATQFADLGLVTGPDLLRVALWRLDAGEPVAADLLVAAAEQAHAGPDHRQAERLARAAGDDGGLPAAMALAGALRRQGRDEEALSVLAGQWPCDDRQRVELELLRVHILYWGLGREHEADVALQIAEDHLSGPTERVLLAAERASIHNFAGRPAQAAAIAGELLDRPDLSPRVRLGVMSAMGIALAVTGRCEAAVAVALQGLDPSLQPIDEVPISVSWAVGTLFLSFAFSGRLVELEATARTHYAGALQLGADEPRGACASALGLAALGAGRIADAELHLREAIAALSANDSMGVRACAFGALAQALALAGDGPAAEQVLDHAEVQSHPAVRLFTPGLRIGAAWAAAASGEISRALSLLREVAAAAAQSGAAGFELQALHAMVRLDGVTAPVAERLLVLAATCDGPYPPLAAEHARAARDGDGPALEEVAARFADAQMRLYAAEASAQAARAHAAAGQAGRSAADRARMDHHLAACDGARPPSLATALAPPQLTRREREVATQAAAGRTSADIAARLVVSVRTVDSHLASVYAKLGVSGRHELPDVLGLLAGESP